MGKTTSFFKALLGFKTTDSPSPRSKPNQHLKRRWSLVKSHTGDSSHPRLRNCSNSLDGMRNRSCNNVNDQDEDASKRAIALVAATAAVVDAAVAAAQAAAEVVRITSRNSGNGGGREELAAIRIQSCFRAYLARKALRALKALVRLQAVVRGHILRKQTADMMRRLQALIRAQARARASRSRFSEPPSSHGHHHGPPTPEKHEHFHRSISKRNNGLKSYARERVLLEGSIDHENDKIVEVDTGEHYTTTNRKKLFQPDQTSLFGNSHSLTISKGSTFQATSSSPCASYEVNSFDDLTKGDVSTPVMSDGPRSCISGYSDHPNYMANTQSSRAKVRSLSAPRLRPHLEVSNSTKMDLGFKYASSMQKVPTKRETFAKKGHSGSCRLDRLGMPIYYMEESEFCGGYWN